MYERAECYPYAGFFLLTSKTEWALVYCPEGLCLHSAGSYTDCTNELDLKSSGVGIFANKAQGPRALLANIPTPLNFQLGNTDTISHLTSRNNQQISLKTRLGNTKKRTGQY